MGIRRNVRGEDPGKGTALTKEIVTKKDTQNLCIQEGTERDNREGRRVGAHGIGEDGVCWEGVEGV